MPKSVEELFDGADQSPQQEAAEIAPEVASPPADASAETTASPAPNAQEAEGKQPDAPVGKEEGAPPAPEDNDGRDPAFGRLRKERNDYREQLSTEKVEKARLEERYKALEERLKAMEAQPQPPQQQKEVSPPNPVAAAVQQAALMTHLNLTEETLREKEGDEAVDAAIATFKQMREQNPALQQQFLSQRNPYKWMFAEVKKRQAQAEIGDDPAAYKAKIEADAKAKLEAEIRAQIAAEAQQAPETSPARPNLPPSLGKVPNAGARGVTYTGPAPIEALWD
jgi:hypothetical protein